MDCTSKSKSSIFSNLEVNEVAAECISAGNVIFSNEGKSLIVTCGSSCDLYSVTTGELLKRLFTCESKIVSCHLAPKNVKGLVALSEEGELVKYDMKSEKIKHKCKLTFNAELLKKQKVKKFKEDGIEEEWNDEVLNDVKKRKFVYGVPQMAEGFSVWLMWCSWTFGDEKECHVTVFFSITGNHLEKVKLPKLPLKTCYKNFCVTQTQDKNVLYVGMGRNCVEVIHYKQGGLKVQVRQVHLVLTPGEVTCLTLLPKEFSFATADSRGLILVWKNILERHPVKASYQWHTVDIHDLAFSDEGAHLYSGGDENVLVKWSFISNQKNFLPRLSSPIWHISVAEGHSLVALSLGDNEIYIIDSNFQKISVVKKYSLYLPSAEKRSNYVLTSDPRNDHLVLSGRPGYLQFISHVENFKFLYSLDVGKTNYMTGDKNIVNLDVTHGKFSRNGSWLVTAMARKDDVLREYRLQFWHYDETKQCFILNTCMELPHDEHDIHALEISSDDLVATSGDDKQFKLWAPFETMDLNVTKTVWSVLSAGKYKMLPCGPLDFCTDATLIAVGFGPALTLWNTNSCTLKCSLVAPFKRDNLKFVKFGKEEHSHLIVTATDTNITAWDIITLTVAWTVNLSVSYLVGDFFNSYMCAFSKKGTLFVFSPGSTSPEFVMEGISNSEVVAAHSLFCLNKENCSFKLYFINANRELLCLRSKEGVREEDTAEMVETHVTPFSAQVAQKTGGGVAKSTSEYVPTKTKKDSHYISSILDAPAHTLPNPMRFCSDFLLSLTIAVQKSVNENNSKAHEATDGDEVVEVAQDDDKDNLSDEVSEDVLMLTVKDLFK